MSIRLLTTEEKEKYKGKKCGFDVITNTDGKCNKDPVWCHEYRGHITHFDETPGAAIEEQIILCDGHSKGVY